MLFEGAAGSGVMSFQPGTCATDTLLTFLLGLGIVFIGLMALILIIKIMGAIMSRIAAKKIPQAVKSDAFPSVPVSHEPDHGELVAAASAAIATVMGKLVSGIRILSMKKVD